MASLLLQPPSSTLSSTPTLFFLRNTHFVLSPTTSLKPFSSSSKKPLLTLKSLTVPLALTESEGSPKSLNEPDPDSQTLTLLQDLADSFDLPVDYFGQLPQDLRLDLNDAAFDLSNGPVIDECGQELGETLLNISRAWEQADTSTSTTLVGKLPLLLSSLTGNSKSAFGKRLVSAGRRFQSMGQYGQGELQTLEEGQVKMQSRLEEEEEAKEVYCNLKPEDKLSHVTSVSRDTGGGLIMVGDGINDAPALAAATVGIVLAQRASATAIAVADVLLLQDNISGVPFCIAKSHQTTSLVKQNVALALSSIFLASLTSVLGFLPLWLTVLLHEGGTLLVCLNSIRALNDPTWSWRQNLVDMVDKFKSVIMFRRRHSTRPSTIEAAPL